MNLAAGLMVVFSVLTPSRIWFPPKAPLTITNASNGEVTLALTDFTGKAFEAKANTALAAGKQVDIKPIFPHLSKPGTYLLVAVPKGKTLPEFVGTPMVVEVRNDKRPSNPNMSEVLVTKVEPLRYLTLQTDQGTMKAVMYYDAAPNTVDAILQLAGEQFYDGLAFHRVVPGFVIQGGDPLGDSRGGPGFQIEAEFNDKKHEEGVLSMAREGDPLEPQMKPRCEYANSAGSQFFICLAKVDRLDGRYTAFGKVVEGLDVVRKIGGGTVADPKTGRPANPVTIKNARVKVVTPADNPYAEMLGWKK